MGRTIRGLRYGTGLPRDVHHRPVRIVHLMMFPLVFRNRNAFLVSRYKSCSKVAVECCMQFIVHRPFGTQRSLTSVCVSALDPQRPLSRTGTTFLPSLSQTAL